jgi:DNA-directed RNA polymerase specialized sigma24 family protein
MHPAKRAFKTPSRPFQWVDALLARWGKWAVSAHALGYASTSPMFRDSPRGDAYGSGKVEIGWTGQDIQDCDEAVKALPAIARAVVVVHYQTQGSLNETARRCGVTAQTVGKHLDQAREMIAKHLGGASEGLTKRQ